MKARLQRLGREMKLVVQHVEDRAAADPGLLRIVARAHDFHSAKRLMRLALKIPTDWAEQRKLLGFRGE